MSYKGLYVHIPFCIRKCKYCDFVSFTDKADFFDAYIDKLLEESNEYTTKLNLAMEDLNFLNKIQKATNIKFSKNTQRRIHFLQTLDHFISISI